MSHGIGHAVVTVFLGLVLAGPLAALVHAGLPPGWRGPLIPAVVAALAVGLVVLVRSRASPRA